MNSIVTIHELSKLLKIPVSTIYDWCHRKRIPYLKCGRHLRFDYEAVLEHFQQSTSTTYDSPTSGSLKIEEDLSKVHQRTTDLSDPFNDGGSS